MPFAFERLKLLKHCQHINMDKIVFQHKLVKLSSGAKHNIYSFTCKTWPLEQLLIHLRFTRDVSEVCDFYSELLTISELKTINYHICDKYMITLTLNHTDIKYKCIFTLV